MALPAWQKECFPRWTTELKEAYDAVDSASVKNLAEKLPVDIDGLKTIAKSAEAKHLWTVFSAFQAAWDSKRETFKEWGVTESKMSACHKGAQFVIAIFHVVQARINI